MAMNFWWGIWLRLLSLGIATLATAYFLGFVWALGITSGGLVLILLLHWWQLAKLMHWVQSGQLEQVPEGRGLWGDLFAALYHQQKARSLERAHLSEALDRLHMAASALPDGVIILDKESRIEWFNSVAARQFGLDLAQDVGTPVTHLIRQPEFASHLNRNVLKDPVVLKAGQGGSERYAVSLIPFAADGRLLLSRDVTQMERAETIRRDFVANVSHELRTPLTVARGFLEHLVEDAEMEVQQRTRFLALVEDQVGRMNRLVDDLLTLSSLEATPQLASEEPVDLAEMAAQVAEEGRLLSNGRHTIDAQVKPLSLRGNSRELHSALANLVGNAVRYTPEGGTITVRCGLEDSVPVFSVSDSGIGIAPEHVPRLTERFYRVDKGRSASTGGTGLGLAIVKHVLQRHQAALDIRSVVGEGSTFRAVFPLSRLIPVESAKVAATA